MRRGSLEPVDALLVAFVVVQQVELWVTQDATPRVSLVMLHAMAPGALLARRRAPLAATLVTLASEAALIQLMSSTLSSWFVGTIVSMAIIGALRLPVAVTGLVGMLGICFEGAFLDRLGEGAVDFAMSFSIMAGAWALGLLLGRRSAVARDLAERSERLEKARDLAAKEAVAAERSRVTRELHDVVAHGLTVLVVQSVAACDALEHGARPEDLLDRLRATEQVARESLGELRMLLGILGEGDDGRAPAAVAGPGGVRELVAQLRATGHPVTLETVGDERALAPGLAMALYRVVQEGLTNVLKHADGATTVVTLSFDRAGEVRVRVTNGPGRAGRLSEAGARRGLAGLAERAHLHGGRLVAGPTPDGGFELACSLPAGGDAEGSGSTGGAGSAAGSDEQHLDPTAGRPEEAAL